MVQRALAVMPALKTSQKLARNSQHIQPARGIKMLFSTHISPMILVIISGILLELEIKISHLFDLVKPHVKGTLVPARRVGVSHQSDLRCAVRLRGQDELGLHRRPT